MRAGSRAADTQIGKTHRRKNGGSAEAGSPAADTRIGRTHRRMNGRSVKANRQATKAHAPKACRFFGSPR